MSSNRVQDFNIVARSSSGSMHALRISATDAAMATRIAERDGLRVLSCVAGRTSLLPWSKTRRPHTRVRLDVALFSHELASLLDAGLGIVDAIDTLAGKERSSETNQVLSHLVQALKEGQNLSTVMAGMPTIFPPLLVASVASSEQTGDMAAALRRYASNFETLRNLRSKAIGAAVYPLVLLAVGMLVVAFLLGIVVPKFSQLIEASRSEIPFASRMLMGIGNAINLHPQFALSLILVTCIMIAAGIYHASTAGWNLSFIQHLPVAGRLIRMFRHAQFYRTGSMLIEGGIPAVRAFEMSGSLLSPEDRRKLEQAIASIWEGASIGTALQNAGLADSVTLRMLAVAQRTGKLADILARIASFQEIALTRAIDVAARLFEPALMLFIGLLIGAIVVLMYLPIFDLASSLQ
jgi:general secretion pathway protein F